MAKKKKKPIVNPDEALATWLGLNDVLRTASSDVCRVLFEAEKNGRARRQVLLRIHSRLNKVRADRERETLTLAGG